MRIAALLAMLALPCLGDVECLKVSGSFDVPIATWAARWAQNGHAGLSVPTGMVSDVQGYYAPCGQVNGMPAWRQVGGSNVVWFGDRRNPRDSFDAWYIGDPACVAVPASRRSIPRLPTFIPNELGNGDGNLDPCRRERLPGVPVVERATITDAQAGVASGGTPMVVAIGGPPGAMSISWRSSTGLSHSVWRARDLGGEWEKVISVKGWDGVVSVPALIPDGWATAFYRVSTDMP